MSTKITIGAKLYESVLLTSNGTGFAFAEGEVLKVNKSQVSLEFANGVTSFSSALISLMNNLGDKASASDSEGMAARGVIGAAQRVLATVDPAALKARQDGVANAIAAQKAKADAAKTEAKAVKAAKDAAALKAKEDAKAAKEAEGQKAA